MTLKEIFENCEFDSEKGDQIMIAVNHRATHTMNSFNYGFNALELLGVLAMRMEDVQRQIRGEFQPKVVKAERTLFVDTEKEKADA